MLLKAIGRDCLRNASDLDAKVDMGIIPCCAYLRTDTAHINPLVVAVRERFYLSNYLNSHAALSMIKGD